MFHVKYCINYEYNSNAYVHGNCSSAIWPGMLCRSDLHLETMPSQVVKLMNGVAGVILGQSPSSQHSCLISLHSSWLFFCCLHIIFTPPFSTTAAAAAIAAVYRAFAALSAIRPMDRHDVVCLGTLVSCHVKQGFEGHSRSRLALRLYCQSVRSRRNSWRLTRPSVSLHATNSAGHRCRRAACQVASWRSLVMSKTVSKMNAPLICHWLFAPHSP